jgi:hypothetical protein
MEAMTKLEALR